MKTRFPEPKKYKHQELMNDLNNMNAFFKKV